MINLVGRILGAIEASPQGIITLDILDSLRLCSASTMKTTLSRLNRSGRIIRLKRGTYSVNPIRNAFAAAQATFNGYIGFTGALYLRGLIAEIPFTVVIVTPEKSSSRILGAYEFRAVALKEKAVGFGTIDGLVVSTRAKTLFDCIYLGRYSVEEEKLIRAYRSVRLSAAEWAEFETYVRRFAPGQLAGRFAAIRERITGK